MGFDGIEIRPMPITSLKEEQFAGESTMTHDEAVKRVEHILAYHQVDRPTEEDCEEAEEALRLVLERVREKPVYALGDEERKWFTQRVPKLKRLVAGDKAKAERLGGLGFEYSQTLDEDELLACTAALALQEPFTKEELEEFAGWGATVMMDRCVGETECDGMQARIDRIWAYIAARWPQEVNDEPR